MTDRRMKLSPDEIAIIEGLRHENAIWNKALEAAMLALAADDINEYMMRTITKVLLELRK